MEDMISIEGLTKKYGDLTAVDNISFRVKEGAFFAFLGPNGAGKTTTINVLCTLLPKTAGELFVNGCEVGREDDRIHESIGVVFQGSVLDRLLTVQENLISRAAFYGMRKKALKERIDMVAEATGIKEFLKRPYGKLSGGQRRRADIARACINTPKLLFLDEPTTGLDPQTRKNVWNMLKGLKDKHRMTIFLTTHYMEEAADADDVAIIDHGKIVAQAAPDELRVRYSSDILRIVPKAPSALERVLKQQKITFSRQAGTFIIPVKNSLQALGILKENEQAVRDFEVLRGNMDDVFLNITGHLIREEEE